MKFFPEVARGAQKHWSVARLQRKIHRAVMLRMSPKEAEAHLEKIALIILWLSVVAPRGSGTSVAYIFGVDVRTLSREMDAPTSPQLLADLTEGLRLLRDEAIALGCWGGTPVARPLVCPSKEERKDWHDVSIAHLHPTAVPGTNHLST